jgi:hypothetical protein
LATLTKLNSGSWRAQVRRKGKYVPESGMQLLSIVVSFDPGQEVARRRLFHQRRTPRRSHRRLHRRLQPDRQALRLDKIQCPPKTPPAMFRGQVIPDTGTLPRNSRPPRFCMLSSITGGAPDREGEAWTDCGATHHGGQRAWRCRRREEASRVQGHRRKRSTRRSPARLSACLKSSVVALPSP